VSTCPCVGGCRAGGVIYLPAKYEKARLLCVSFTTEKVVEWSMSRDLLGQLVGFSESGSVGGWQHRHDATCLMDGVQHLLVPRHKRGVGRNGWSPVYCVHKEGVVLLLVTDGRLPPAPDLVLFCG
jgi:hypothetical protein